MSDDGCCGGLWLMFFSSRPAKIEPGPGPHDVYCSHQHTERAFQTMKEFVGENPRSIKASMPPFNKGKQENYYPDLVQVDVPCFGLSIVNETLAIFENPRIQEIAKQLGLTIPSRRFDAFVKGKVPKIRKLITAAKERNDRNSKEATERLEAFADAFEGLEPSSITSAADWDAFLRKYVVPAHQDDWQTNLHFDHLLSNFGFDNAAARALRTQTMLDDGKTVTLEQYSLRWLGKAMGAYSIAGTLTDVVNLIFAMLGEDVPGKPSEEFITQRIKDFSSLLEKNEWDKMWIPDCLVFDAELDDTLAWLLLKYVHACLDSLSGKPYVLAQLPEDIGPDPLDQVTKKLELQSVKIFVDPNSKNGKNVKTNFCAK